ncbi:hypothetical protein Q1695_003130 [Nippostrongylus brasiliensis]|nr:hypothetical protein Q1695_003130 [Nippostrongylus brasiliensis]
MGTQQRRCDEKRFKRTRDVHGRGEVEHPIVFQGYFDPALTAMFHPVSMLKNASDLASMIAHLFIKDKDNSRSHAKIKGVQKRRRPSFAMKGCQRVRHRTPSIYSDHSRSLSSVYADEPGKIVFSADGDAIPSGMTDAEEHVLPEDAPSTSDELPSDRRPTADEAVSSKRISLSKGTLVRSMSSDTIIEIHSYTSKLLKGITRDSEAARSAVPEAVADKSCSRLSKAKSAFALTS